MVIWRFITNNGSILEYEIDENYKHNSECECFINPFTDKRCIIKGDKYVNEK